MNGIEKGISREQIHIPVMVKEVIELLDIVPDGVYIDATVGLGGHSKAILSYLGSKGRLIGIDRDEEAIKYSEKRLNNERVFLKKGSFSQIEEILLSMGVKQIDGVLFDLGVSMLQLKDMDRGFSFMSEKRLDMRMDLSQELTAWDVINNYPENELERVIREYGEEPFARKIARAIVKERSISPINTCIDLSTLIARIYRKRGKTHPATRVFQALRIEVNKELSELKKGLMSAVRMLRVGGRIAVISYHSLEDRIVKNFMKENAREGYIRIITKKPIVPTKEEIMLNPSSRSAKLRGGEKICQR